MLDTGTGVIKFNSEFSTSAVSQDPSMQSFGIFESWFRIRIRVKSWIRIPIVGAQYGAMEGRVRSQRSRRGSKWSL
jgi:hypothetical protein